MPLSTSEFGDGQPRSLLHRFRDRLAIWFCWCLDGRTPGLGLTQILRVGRLPVGSAQPSMTARPINIIFSSGGEGLKQTKPHHFAVRNSKIASFWDLACNHFSVLMITKLKPKQNPQNPLSACDKHPRPSFHPRGAPHRPSRIAARAFPLSPAPSMDHLLEMMFKKLPPDYFWRSHQHLRFPSPDRESNSSTSITRYHTLSSHQWRKMRSLLAHQLELTFPVDAQKLVAPPNAAQASPSAWDSAIVW